MFWVLSFIVAVFIWQRHYPKNDASFLGIGK